MKLNKGKGLLFSLGAVALGLSLLGGINEKVSANSSTPITTIASKSQIPGTKSPSFLYGRGLVTTHTDKSHKGRLYATSE
ncbi:MAG: hypothetical protein M3026_06740, partial [Bombilactobacillus sp.]|nr:hypothetical protein [Bombilactobacillus sp.]